MKIKLTATYDPHSVYGVHGEIHIFVGDARLVSIPVERPPGAEPDARDNLIREVMEDYVVSVLRPMLELNQNR